MKPVMSLAEIEVFLAEVFPQIDGRFVIRSLDGDGAQVTMKVSDADLRPGDTVSGPAMFGLADVAAYIAVLSRIGPVALAVTTNCSIDFMRRPVAGADLEADAQILKLGRRLAVIDVRMRSAGSAALVTRASLTYAIPPDRAV